MPTPELRDEEVRVSAQGWAGYTYTSYTTSPLWNTVVNPGEPPTEEGHEGSGTQDGDEMRNPVPEDTVQSSPSVQRPNPRRGRGLCILRQRRNQRCGSASCPCRARYGPTAQVAVERDELARETDTIVRQVGEGNITAISYEVWQSLPIQTRGRLEEIRRWNSDPGTQTIRMVGLREDRYQEREDTPEASQPEASRPVATMRYCGDPGCNECPEVP